MKYLMIFAATAAMMFGQDAKVDKAPSAIAKPTERPLTETESLKLQLSIANLKLLNQEYRLEEYNTKAKPQMDIQQEIAVAACKSVGVPEDKITTECGIATGIGPDGKPAVDANGKPVQPRVWHVTQAPPPVTEKK